LDKNAIHRQLLGHIVARATSTPTSQTRAPPVRAAANLDPTGPGQEGFNPEDPNLEESDDGDKDFEDQDHDLQQTVYSPPRQGDSILNPGNVQNSAQVDQSSGIIRFRPDRPRQAETKLPAQSRTMPQYSDICGIHLWWIWA